MMTMDDVDTSPHSTLEDTQSPFVAEAALAQADSRVDERDAARWFFIAAALIALTDIVIVARFMRELPNALVVAALAIALVGIVADLEIGPRRAAFARWDFLEDALAAD